MLLTPPPTSSAQITRGADTMANCWYGISDAPPAEADPFSKLLTAGKAVGERDNATGGCGGGDPDPTPTSWWCSG